MNSLQADFGSGMVLSYRKGAQGETRERRQGVIVVELPEQHGYDTLAKPMNQLEELFTGRREVVPLQTGDSVSAAKGRTAPTHHD